MSKFSLKKITALIMALVLILGTLAIGSFAGQTVAPLFTISDINTNQGEKFDVTIKFAQDVSPSDVNIAALDVSLEYNSSVYTPVKVTNGAGLESAFDKLKSSSALHLETGDYIFGSSIKEAGAVKWSMSTLEGFTFKRGTDFAVVTFKANDISSLEGELAMTVKVTNAMTKSYEPTTTLYSDAKNTAKIEVNLSKLCNWELNSDGVSYTLAKFNDVNAQVFTIPDTYRDGTKAALPVTKVKVGSFAECTKMQEIVFGKNIKTVDSGTFFGCETLKKATFYADDVKIGEFAFLGTPTSLVIKCRRGSAAEAFATKNKYAIEYFGDASTFTCTDTDEVKEYTGTPVKLSKLKVTDSDGKVLTEGKDYTVSYSNNVMVGTATAQITGIGEYTGTCYFNFQIFCPYHSTSNITGFYTEKNVCDDCLKGGYVEKNCAFCGYNDKSTTIPAKAHVADSEKIIEEATCQKEGKETVVCKECRAVISVTPIPKTEHKYDWVVTTKPVCKTDSTEAVDGVKTWQCVYCGEADPSKEGKPTEAITASATGHSKAADWTVTKETTCTAAGEQVKYCTECGAVVETEAIPAKAHTPSVTNTKVYAPTCTKDGYIEYYCEDCGQLCDSKTLENKFNHDWSALKVIEEATCEKSGRQGCVCSICGAEDKVTVINAKGHDYTTSYVVIKEPTCSENGINGMKCKNCGEAKPGSAYSVAATGHSYGAWSTVVEATCQKDGLKQRTCSKCGDVEVQTIGKTAHKEKWVTVILPTYQYEGTEKAVCEYCDYDFKKTRTVSKIVPDVNGDSKVNATDALHILEHATELRELTGTNLKNADCNGDTSVNSTDALIVLQISVGIIKL